jgi:hypothetical protein
MIALKKYIVSHETAIDSKSYSVKLTLILHDESNSNIPEFSKEIASTSANTQTGYKVDIQRDTEISDYITTLNA